VPTLLRLREAVGPVVGANYDPSHLLWMGADPIAAIGALGDALLNYVTLGHGRDAEFWREFCAALQLAGYDDVLSIEHEDQAMDPVEAVTESVRLLRHVTAQLALV
jgi:sugar phosphate isomerase/epimerase